jgi:hypothetical protein
MIILPALSNLDTSYRDLFHRHYPLLIHRQGKRRLKQPVPPFTSRQTSYSYMNNHLKNQLEILSTSYSFHNTTIHLLLSLRQVRAAVV